jgi:chromosome segregation ATPase
MTTTSEPVAPAADLTAKYQKLATEYAKIRAQMGVLKKGLLDEQDKSGRLTDQVHEKDMQLRKTQGEMEAVLFRNQQLTKRVNVLQDEAEALQKHKGRSKWSRRDKDRDRSTSKDRTSNSSLLSVTGVDSAEAVINEELVAKITENAELKVKLADIETTYEGTIQALRTRVEDLEREKAELNSGQRVRESEVNQVVEDLKKDNTELHQRIENLERDGLEKKDEIVQLQVQLESSVERCEGLELESRRAMEREDQGTQYNFIDEEEEEESERQKREMESLAQKLDSNLTKIRDLEKDREHWKLEYQLIQLKMEKLKEGNSSSLSPLTDTVNMELEEVNKVKFTIC